MDTNSHPIPQDVTGFQFKLIGTMTVKQFAYLAVPAVFDWILYYAPLVPWYIKIPLMILFALIGVALAFLPVEGRPADVMFRHFMNALFAPNQYIYHKTGQNLAFVTINTKRAPTPPARTQAIKEEQQRSQKLQLLLQTNQQQNPQLDEREAAFMKTVTQFSPQTTQQVSISQAKAGHSFHLPPLHLFGGAQPQSLPHASITPSVPQTQAPLPKEHEQTMPTAVLTARPLQAPSPSGPPVMQSIQHISQTQSMPISTGLQKPTTHPFISPLATPPHATMQLPPLPTDRPAQQTPIVAKPPVPIVPVTMPVQQPIQMSPPINPAPVSVATIQSPVQSTPTIQNAVDVAAQLKKMQEEKTKLEQELARLRQHVPAASVSPTPASSIPFALPATPLPPPVKANAAAAINPPQIAHVTKISKEMAQKMGLPTLPDTPNLVTGIVKDPRGNVLGNILVEVKDKEGNPVRAFKTNPLGQFASATPLLNGTYTIVFEDPNGANKFDTIEITIKGEVVSPIGVISRDAREELRKALFN